LSEANGNSIQKLLPVPTCDSTPMRPSIDSTKVLVITRPIQTYPRAFDGSHFRTEAVEGLEQLAEALGRDAGPAVRDRDSLAARRVLRAMDRHPPAIAVVFDRI